MNFVVLDLEWSGAYSRRIHRFINEIIEFGAVKFNENFEVIDKFSMLIRPQISGRVSNEVINLMGITKDELLKSKYNFLYTFNAFSNFCKDCVLLTWGVDDILALMDNYEYYTGRNRLPFLSHYCDLQDYCHKNLGCEIETDKLGLRTCAEKLDLSDIDGKYHRAYFDAELSMRCMKELYDKDEFQPFVVYVNEEFYRRITFKTKRITDIYHPFIKENDLDFTCEDCGYTATIVSKYNIRNRSLFADYYCEKCHNEFKGRITLTLKFDHIVVKKSVVEEKTEEDNE